LKKEVDIMFLSRPIIDGLVFIEILVKKPSVSPPARRIVHEVEGIINTDPVNINCVNDN
jgi:hypothetical protein